jgi:hypothetical protein
MAVIPAPTPWFPRFQGQLKARILVIKRRDEMYFAVANMCPAHPDSVKVEGPGQRAAFSFARLSPTVRERNANIVL